MEPAQSKRVFWMSDDLPTGPLTIWRGSAPDIREVEYVPRSAAERLATALALLRGHVTDDEGWKLINDALWLGARDENDEPIHG